MSDTRSAGEQPSLTPTQELILDLLAARDALGQPWPDLSTRVRPAAIALAEMGLIELTHGVIDNTFRANITAGGLRRRATVALQTGDLPNPGDIAYDLVSASMARTRRAQEAIEFTSIPGQRLAAAADAYADCLAILATLFGPDSRVRQRAINRWRRLPVRTTREEMND